MPPAWPSSLPQEFEAQGFSDVLPEQALRARGRGAEGQRSALAGRVPTAPLAGQMLMTTTQWGALLDFYRNDLDHGALAFDLPDPDDSSATIAVSFSSPPALTTIGGDFHSIALELERQS